MPLANSLFGKFYSISSWCFFKVGENFEIILSEQGARMGCVVGSFAFCLAVQDVYEEVLSKFPELKAKAIVDDFTGAVLPPQSEEEQEEFRCRTGAMFAELAERALELTGLELNFGKCHVLVPPGTTPPREEWLPKGISIEMQGLRVAGTPVGTDAYCEKFMEAQCRDAIKKLEALQGIDPQAGIKLLKTCVVPSLPFFLQVIPSQLVLPCLERFDEAVVACVLGLLSTKEARAPECSKSRMERAILKLQLPTRHMGLGCTSMARIAPAAFWSSVAAACVHDDELNQDKIGLMRFADTTLTLVRASLGAPSDSSCEGCLPLVASDWLGTFYVVKYDLNPDLKLQRVLSAVAQANAAKELEERILHTVDWTVTDSDRVNFSTPTVNPLFFCASLASRFNRLEPELFISFTRFFLGLPQLTRLGRPIEVEGVDYPMVTCLDDHWMTNADEKRRYMDLHGNHACGSCPSAAAGQSKRHDGLKHLVIHMGKRAGLQTKLEPSTHSLLLHFYSEKECAKMFPKNLPKKRQENLRNLVADAAEHEAQGPHQGTAGRQQKQRTGRCESGRGLNLH